MSEQNNVYNFVLVLSGVSEPTSEIEDALFDAGCDDATLGFRSGVAYLEFDREAPSLGDAIVSAIRDVERARPRLKVVAVEPGDSVNASEIARRAKVTREYIRLLVEGERGGGDFPAPQSGIAGKTLVWSWAGVVQWLRERDLIKDPVVVETALTIRDINDALEIREHPATLDRRLKFLRELQEGQRETGTRS